MKNAMDRDREGLLSEKNRMEVEWAEIIKREDQLQKIVMSVKSLRDKLEEMKERLRENLNTKLEKMQQDNDNLLLMANECEHKLTELNSCMENARSCVDLFQREKESLISTMSNMFIQTQSMKTQWKQKLDLENQTLCVLKKQIEDERNDVNRENEKLTENRLKLEMTNNNIQIQSDMLYQVMKEGKDKLEKLKTELQEKTGQADNLLFDINTQNSIIKDVILQVQSDREKLVIALNTITLKEREQQVKENDLTKLQQQLETSKTAVAKERQELEELKEQLRREKQDIESERKQLEEMKNVMETSKTAVAEERQELEELKEQFRRSNKMLRVKENSWRT
ncbi:uncharacterized protein [Takifugu rubripes]|uniref:uncharacterized protein n=1 Tax=Takifugu rubripes TaxID=31033 RepID=UPI0011458F8F|nr:uncharacterized protein LOC115252615 [Takifugu rubripes]